MKNEPTAARLRIVLEQPTAGVDFGLQKGHGGDYEVVEKQRSKGGAKLHICRQPIYVSPFSIYDWRDHFRIAYGRTKTAALEDCRR